MQMGGMPGQADQSGMGNEQNPDFSGFEQIQGYGNVGFGQGTSLAPPPPPPPPTGDAPQMDFGRVGTLSEDEVRDALLEFVSKNCCYGKGVANDMKVEDIKGSTALHYTLETFCEGRSTERKFLPYRGEFVDGPGNGIAPQPWEIPCQADQMFVNHQKYIEVPHTSIVQPCWNCHATGQVRCRRCGGDGRVRCHTCGGDGRRTVHGEGGPRQEPCFACGADGQIRCSTCGGDGRVTCGKCKGACNLRWFIQLCVDFKNHVDDYILEETDMPDHLVRNAAGNTIFEQTLYQVWPIIAYPVPQINQASTSLVQQHSQGFPGERWLHQRHNLRGVPVTEVKYNWKEVNKRYWVFGEQRDVHCPDYPQDCCWG